LKLLLDTTYFLRAIGINVKGVDWDVVIRLMREGHEISMSDITIFELSAKGAKHVAAGALPVERVTRGIRALVYDKTVTAIPIHETTLLITAFKLRRLLSDFIDCLILASAMNECDSLITEDSEIQNLRKNREFDELLAKTNPRFKIQTLTETL